jgi:hypothetical protein
MTESGVALRTFGLVAVALLFLEAGMAVVVGFDYTTYAGGNGLSNVYGGPVPIAYFVYGSCCVSAPTILGTLAAPAQSVIGYLANFFTWLPGLSLYSVAAAITFLVFLLPGLVVLNIALKEREEE